MKKLTIKLNIIISMILVATITVVFAWFVSGDNGKIPGIDVEIGSGYDFDYDFYQYHSLTSSGNPSTNPTLTGNDSGSSNVWTDGKYTKIVKTSNPFNFVRTGNVFFPGNKYSFAFRIKNTISENVGHLDLFFKDFVSSGVPTGHTGVNEVQRAIEYKTIKISYLNNNIETTDQINGTTILGYRSHFAIGSTELQFAKAPLASFGSSNSEILVYFDLYFDPAILCFDLVTGLPLTSHGSLFKNQKFSISKILVLS